MGGATRWQPDTSLLNLFTTALDTITRGHNLKYFKPCCTSRCRYNFFPYKIVDDWSKLPAYIVNAYSIKNLLDNFCSDNLFIVS